MKKGLITVAVFLIILIGVVLYFFIWGGQPQIENFQEVARDYETVTELAIRYYQDLSPEKEFINIDFYDGGLTYDGGVLQLTENQKKAVEQAGMKFGYLRVSKDAVFFCVDETGYYGLVYSKAPLRTLYQVQLPQQGRQYHRLNRHWYEWGVWGI